MASDDEEDPSKKNDALLQVLKQACSRNRALEKRELWSQKTREDRGGKNTLSVKTNDGKVRTITTIPQDANVTPNAVNQYEAERLKNMEKKEDNSLRRYCDGRDGAWRPDSFFIEGAQCDKEKWAVRPGQIYVSPHLISQIMSKNTAKAELKKKEKKRKKEEEKVKAKADKKSKKHRKDKKGNKDKDRKKKKGKKDKKEKKEKKRRREEGDDKAPEAPAPEPAAPEPDVFDEFLTEAFDPAADFDPNADEPSPLDDADKPMDSIDAALFEPFAPDGGQEAAPGSADGQDNFLDQVFGDLQDLHEDDFERPKPRDDARLKNLPQVTHLPGRGRKSQDKDQDFKNSASADKEKWPESFSGKFTKVLDSIKPMKALMIKDEDSHPYVQGVIDQMLAAAQRDREDFSKGLPMVHKMALLPKALTVMSKHAFADIFVTFDGCQALAYWLQSLPDPTRTLPNEHLRTELLTAMMRLPITKEALANCKDAPLGAVVKNLQLDPRETIANRKMAGALVQKWLKQVLTQKTQAALEDEDEEETAPKATIPRPPPETEETLRQLEEQSAKRFHPEIPIIHGREYHIKPIPVAQPVRREKVAMDTNRGKIGEVLKVMSRPNKRAWKPYTVSIAGRTVNAP